MLRVNKSGKIQQMFREQKRQNSAFVKGKYNNKCLEEIEHTKERKCFGGIEQVKYRNFKGKIKRQNTVDLVGQKNN